MEYRNSNTKKKHAPIGIVNAKRWQIVERSSTGSSNRRSDLAAFACVFEPELEPFCNPISTFPRRAKSVALCAHVLLRKTFDAFVSERLRERTKGF
jgi:hypothetical protein